MMQALKLRPLLARLGELGAIPDDAVVAPTQITNTFEALISRSVVQVLTDDEKRALMEVSLGLAQPEWNFSSGGRSLGPIASDTVQELLATNPDFEWRPSPAEPDPIEP